MSFRTDASVRVHLQDGSGFISFRTVVCVFPTTLSDLCTERN